MMEEDTIEKLKKQHVGNYQKAILENVSNNKNVLVDDDIMSLLRKPPLDSMDLIKSKFLDLAKKNKLILNTDNLDKILDEYRKDVIKVCTEIKKKRIDELSKKVEDVKFESENDIIKFNKKDFLTLNREIKKLLKDKLLSSLELKIMKKVDTVFQDDVDLTIQNKIINEIVKYIKGSYQKQLLENIDFKILVKDTTLINGTKEQTDRYLFTLNNSRLLNNDLD